MWLFVIFIRLLFSMIMKGLFFIKVFVCKIVLLRLWGWFWWIKWRWMLVVLFINFSKLCLFFFLRLYLSLKFELKWFLIECFDLLVIIRIFLIFDLRVFFMINWIVGLFIIGNIFLVSVLVVGKNWVLSLAVGMIVFLIFDVIRIFFLEG